MSTSMTRASRYKPRLTKKELCFTERDFVILYSLYKYHLLSTPQLAEIHQGSKQKTRKRLRKLYDCGYVKKYNTKMDFNKPGSEPDAYALTDLGANWLSQHRPDIERQKKRYNENNDRRKKYSIPHALMLSDIMVRFELACYYRPAEATFVSQREVLARTPDVVRNRRTPTHWNNKIFLKGEEYAVGNNPDQMFGVVNKKRDEGHGNMYFFLEADRGTETVRPITKHLNKSTIYKKMLGYCYTHAHKVHSNVFGDWMRNFRVLWVIDSNAPARDGRTRLQNFLDTTQTITDGCHPDLFLFTTYDALKAAPSPLAHTWVNADGKPRLIIP